MIDFVDGTGRATAKLFAECLTNLPNLHTLEIASIWEDRIAQSFATALEERKLQLQLQQVRTLTLDPMVHCLLLYCPNVEDLMCCGMEPDGGFVKSLVAGGLINLTKFSVLYPGKRNIWPSGVYFISHSPLIR